MEHAEDVDLVRHHDIGRNIGRSWNDELPGARNPAGAPALWGIEKTPDGMGDPIIDTDGAAAGLSASYMVEDRVTVAEGEARPR